MKNIAIIILFVSGILLSGCVGTDQKQATDSNRTDVIVQKGPIKIIDKSVIEEDVNIDNISRNEYVENGVIIDNQGIDEYGGDNTDIDDISNYDADG